MSPALHHFQCQVGAAHALQVVVDLGDVGAAYFDRLKQQIVPARTLLSAVL